MSWYDDHIKKKKENVLKRGESFHESEIFCPYCAEEQDSTEVWESGLKPNGEQEEYECSHCEKEFLITADVVFSTEKKEQ